MATDARSVIYTGVDTPYIPIVPNTDLQTILQNIDTALNNSSSAPDYSGYDLGCVRQEGGAPTDTQEFAELISELYCTLRSDYDTFTGTTYVTDSNIWTDAINGLQSPALTYTPFDITDADNITVVWNKVFDGLDDILAALDPSGGNWGSLSITPPTTVTTGFNSLIAYIGTMNSTITGKQAAIANIDNSGNCLSGTASDTIRETVVALTTYTCTLPTYDADNIDFLAVVSAADLQDSVQNIINSISGILSTSVVLNGTGLLIEAVGSTYEGTKLSIDPTWLGLAKVAINADDTGGYLEDKIESLDGSITISKPDNNKLDLSITNPIDWKVKVNSDDENADYLNNKLIGGIDSGNWGISINTAALSDNSRVNVYASLEPGLLFSQMMTFISQDPTLFTQFSQLVNQTSGGTCAAPTSLVVVLNTGDFDLSWTPTGLASFQTVKYRPKGAIGWVSNANIVSPNPQLTAASTASVTLSSSVNIVHELAVDSVCTGGGIATSNVYEMVFYADTVVTPFIEAGVISVNQNPLPGIDTIQYRLLDSSPAVIQNTSSTGLSPNTIFSAVSSGTYSVEWRLGTSVNGVTLYSDDASQLGAWSSLGGIVVP